MYRKCVGMILLNSEKKVFVGQRNDKSSEAWQLPQGGVEEGESFHDALFREMEEEVGTRNAEIVSESPNLLRYDLPKDLRDKLWNGKYIGQEQKWYLMKFLGNEEEINIYTPHQEFTNYKWVEIDEISSLIVEFKRSLYLQLVTIFKPIINNL